eukprot:GHUV01048428.1.p1 GENE.GHUV01048428.1~~GHUV01048428.1.p1  ORF type:complete len:174 (+),score=45.19 GHUV01048428.1:103-624(+)
MIFLPSQYVAVCLPSRLQLGHPFSIAAMGELRYIHNMRGEELLAENLGRHILSTTRAQSQKQAGKLHGNEAWMGFYQQTGSQDQQEIIVAARERKRDLGLIRQPRGRSRRSSSTSSSSGSSRRGNGRGSISKQNGQQQEHVNGSGSSRVETFDFDAATAATIEQFSGRKRRGS